MVRHCGRGANVAEETEGQIPAMKENKTSPLDRRGFLKTAAASTAAATVPTGAQSQVDEHVHDHQDVPSDPTLRVKALESLLVEKGVVDRAALDALVDTFEHKIGPRNGARVVAKAWSDPAYKQRLLTDATKAIAELSYSGREGEDMMVVENTPTLQNMVVCTLCSCYPWPTLGLPPVWYKSAPYRSRSVIDPRGVLKDSEWNFPTMSRFASGTAQQSCGISFCPSGPPERME